MSVNSLRLRTLDTFRSAWVCGHLDYQRASDALDAARRKDEAEEVREAERRLSEVEAELTGKFNRFCGLGE
ncbi:MAG TPA: hypothetical protein VKU41_07890 [Polyangiaceae bacterium]|nr:hypothetical protein [Polyangiaceae bacterium]